MFDDYKILYLEDEPIIALDTEQHLLSMNFGEVVVVNRLADATAATNETAFDAAVLDINVGRGETSIALGHLLAERGVRVIFASGNGGDREKLIADGFKFIDKPFSMSMLTRALTEVLQPAA